MGEDTEMLGVDDITTIAALAWKTRSWVRGVVVARPEVFACRQRLAGLNPDESEWVIAVRVKSLFGRSVKHCRAGLRFIKSEPFQGQGEPHPPPSAFRRPFIDLMWQETPTSEAAATKDLQSSEVYSLPVAIRKIERRIEGRNAPTRAHVKSARFFNQGENELEPGFHYVKLVFRSGKKYSWEYPDYFQITVPDDDQNNGQFTVAAIPKEEYERRLG